MTKLRITQRFSGPQAAPYGSPMDKNIYDPPMAKTIYGPPMDKNTYGPSMAKNIYEFGLQRIRHHVSVVRGLMGAVS